MMIEIDAKQTFVYLGKADHKVQADPSKPAIFFLHGAEQDHSCWALQSRWFAHHGWNVYVPDLPGHGQSAGAPLQTIEELANWLTQLIQALGMKTVTLVGHSMGSLIGLQTAIANPACVSRLALIGSAVPMPVSDGLLDAANNNEPKAIAMVNHFSHSSNAQMGRNTVPGMWMLGMNQRLMERQKPGVFFRDLSACNQYSIEAVDFAHYSVPTILIAGAEDKMTAAKSARKLAGQIPGAQLKVIPGVGHALMSEAPDLVLDYLIEFVS